MARFLTLDQVAEELSVSRAQAYALVRHGDLPAIKAGGLGQWRVERAKLESYIVAAYQTARSPSRVGKATADQADHARS